MALEQFLPIQVFAFLLVFSRLAGTLMLLPGLGEAYVPPRVRLLSVSYTHLTLPTTPYV